MCQQKAKKKKEAKMERSFDRKRKRNEITVKMAYDESSTPKYINFLLTHTRSFMFFKKRSHGLITFNNIKLAHTNIIFHQK